ncbi:uncharacterized protein LOC122505080 [Leptopilina heterotoma]|uniref:uncharacterized protein LOC122505080 n=1 Tax=Leptopilina heterotoma TaxID=63436 RepID=UPI001CA91A54|nr:uncharacterized protein LOC122505080 [Leptopilina heterotoma]
MDKTYVIVSFDDGVEVVRKDWVLYDENREIISSYFPSNVTAIQLRKLLLNSKNSTTFDKKAWSDKDGNPYLVRKVHGFDNNLDKANKRVDLQIKLSEISSDDDTNMEKLKRSRHSRCMKKGDDDAADGTKIQKLNPFTDFKNSLLKPTVSGSSVSSGLEKRTKTVTDDSNEEKLSGDDAIEQSKMPNQLDRSNRSGKNVLQTCLDEFNSFNESRQINARNNLSENLDASGTSKSRSKKTDAIDSRLLLNSLNELKMMIKAISTNEEGTSNNCANFDSDDNDLSIFPAKTKEEVENIENKLKSSKTFLQKVVCTSYKH